MDVFLETDRLILRQFTMDDEDLLFELDNDPEVTRFINNGSRALIDRGFNDFGVERVYAETMVVNNGSWRVMEKTGLRRVRTYHADWPVRIPGDEQGDYVYAITRQKWAADRAQ